jgi:hypothetical protein
VANNVVLDYGRRVYFGERSGRIVGHTICKRISHAEDYENYYIVELDPSSRDYLGDDRDFFVSMVLVHMENARLPVVGL